MIYNPREFPEPLCPTGYPWNQIEELLDDTTFKEFRRWMYGQTQSICDGRQYDHEARKYEPDQCADYAHGAVVYTYDLHRFLGFLGPHQKNLWD